MRQPDQHHCPIQRHQHRRKRLRLLLGLTGLCLPGNAQALRMTLSMLLRDDILSASHLRVGGNNLWRMSTCARISTDNRQPQSSTYTVGTTVSFSVTATGAGTARLSMEQGYNQRAPYWKHFGVTNTILTINNVQLTNAGSYALVVTNALWQYDKLKCVLTVTLSSPVTDFNYTTNSDGSITVTGYHGFRWLGDHS